MALIGIAGLGRMGSAMALRLLEQDHTLIVWNRTQGRTAPLINAGATLASSPAELARRSEIIITILTDAAAIEAVYSGPQGLLANGLAGKLAIEMSTVRPETAKAGYFIPDLLLLVLPALYGFRVSHRTYPGLELHVQQPFALFLRRNRSHCFSPMCYQ